MKRVALIAPTGMLGSMVYNVLKDRYHLVLVYRDRDKCSLLEQAYGGTGQHTHVVFEVMDLYKDYVQGFKNGAHGGENTQRLLAAVGNVDAVINCAGITKPHSLKDPIVTMFVNGGLPHVLSYMYGDRLIHITSDCVYDGLHGAPYTERHVFSPTDLYGISKRLGEPSSRAFVLRTSIIGPEIANHVLLISWFKQQDGKTIQGYTNHLWNGITTRAFGEICDRIISNREAYPRTGLYHVFSSDVTKFHMLEVFKEKYGVRVTIEPVEAFPIDRRLGTEHELCKQLRVPVFEEMMAVL